jgi:pimeloyl-ACP methyl ester carboxylesterase
MDKKMVTSQEKSFKTPQNYFDYMADTLGYPPYHHHFQSDTIMSDGLRLHLDIYEYDKKAPTIVFIPGTAIYALCYSEMLYKLGKAGYNVVGLDPRGHGHSEGIRGDYTVSELMEDIRNTIDYAIGRFNKKITLMGSSQGGILAFYMAARDERIDAVICQNFADLTGEYTTQLTRHPRLFKYLRVLIGGRAGELIQNAMIPMSAYIDMDSIPVKYFGTIRHFIENDPFAVKNISIRALQSLGNTPLDKPVSRIKVPVMVFQGDKDSIFPVSYTQSIFDQLTCPKRMIVYPNMSHALMSENVDEILPDIVTWLTDIYGK